MTSEQIAHYIEATYPDCVPIDAWGETSFFYNPGKVFARGTYFATLKSKNGDNDKASELDRAGVFRLNIGVAVSDYEELFGPRPARPGKGGIVKNPLGPVWNFTALDRMTPHPVYGWMGWVSVLNPSDTTLERCKPLIDSAHEKAKTSFEKRLRKVSRDES